MTHPSVMNVVELRAVECGRTRYTADRDRRKPIQRGRDVVAIRGPLILIGQISNAALRLKLSASLMIEWPKVRGRRRKYGGEG